MVVGLLDELVVSIDKLDVTTCRHLDTFVAGIAESAVLLANIYDVIAIV
jgi:hypothetical protein